LISAHFGDGSSKQRFLEIMKSHIIWNVNIQKYFVDHFSR
jgi:hypothetical protein